MIHTSRKTYETNMALNHIESTLNDNSFIRCYRSYLVNMNYIQDILDTEIQLTNDDCIPLTLRKRSQIVKLFNKFLISHSGSEKREEKKKKPPPLQDMAGSLPVKRTIKNNKFLYRQPCYGWRYFMLLLYIAHDISLVSLHAVSFEVVGCCSNLCN